MTTRTATCSCGQLSITTEGEPIRNSMCHCYACQKRTGSLFGVQAWFATENATPKGRASIYKRKGDDADAGTITFSFCPDCGSTVYYQNDATPGRYGVPVGGFADITFPPPRVAVYVDRRRPWATMPDLQLDEEYG